MLENLKKIEKLGVELFLKDERAKWTCPECGGTICVHKGYCFACKKMILIG